MNNYEQNKLDTITEDLRQFLETEYTNRFKDLTAREDRQLFYLAGILTKLKNISRIEQPEEIAVGNVLEFPLHRVK